MPEPTKRRPGRPRKATTTMAEAAAEAGREVIRQFQVNDRVPTLPKLPAETTPCNEERAGWHAAEERASKHALAQAVAPLVDAAVSRAAPKPGGTVADFERAFAKYVGAQYAVAVCNGTATLHAAVHVLIQPGQPVLVPPLTMASTSIAIVLAGGVPQYVDVDPDTMLMYGTSGPLAVPVSLFGLHYDHALFTGPRIDDAAQTLRPHDPRCAFTSYSFQVSKILSTGEGGMLVTNDEALAQRAREFASLGYRMPTGHIDKSAIKDPGYLRHQFLAPNYRMADAVAAVGLQQLAHADERIAQRRAAMALYREAVKGCVWLKTQTGEPHDGWAFAAVLPQDHMFGTLADAVERHGGERPYAAWAITYREPALRQPSLEGSCKNAEQLQRRLALFQTNKRDSAERNADALAKTIKDIGG